MIIHPLRPTDYDQWLPLWLANTEHALGNDVTAETWRRICEPTLPVGGLGARTDPQAPLSGICHYILHPTTGNLKQVCYMQDLYINPGQRRQGLARSLVNTLADLAKKQGWARIYWLAEAENEAAQTLYKSLGYKLNFTLHVLPTC